MRPALGISISIKDMMIPPSKEELLKKAHDDVREIEEQYKNGTDHGR
jgi:DNA-directed RNA polymerase subunit beta'